MSNQLENKDLTAWYDVSGEYCQVDTDELLKEWCNEAEDVTRGFERWNDAQDAKQPRLLGRYEQDAFSSWFEAAAAYMEKLGYKEAGAGNTYNGESDLTADFDWHVWEHPRDENREWIYPDDRTITVIFPHLGGDPRGNYGRPKFYMPGRDGSFHDQYSIPVDVMCGWQPVEARNRKTGKRVTDKLWEIKGLDHYSIGYASNPTYQLLEDAERIFTKANAEKVEELVAVFPEWIVKFYIESPIGR